MCDEWMPVVRFPLDAVQFERLPRNGAYRYEYGAGTAHLMPNPRAFHCRLDLATFAPAAHEIATDVAIGPLRAEGHAELATLFASAFERIQPFAGLDQARRLDAATQSLDRTFTGVDGPWIPDASRTARDLAGTLVGGILLTLLPDGDPAGSDVYRWSEPPPPDLWDRGRGQPHLTWIFVDPMRKGHGVGTRLLVEATAVLRARGYRHLLSTFIAGNDSSLLWHWRSGFELLPYSTSRRVMRSSASSSRNSG
jgi:GNAT superfamily N-acetyltransferase